MGLQEIDWEYAGACLARGDANEQTKFFKAFVKECRTWGTRWLVQQQLACVNRLLSDSEKECLGMIGKKGES